MLYEITLCMRKPHFFLSTFVLGPYLYLWSELVQVACACARPPVSCPTRAFSHVSLTLPRADFVTGLREAGGDRHRRARLTSCERVLLRAVQGRRRAREKEKMMQFWFHTAFVEGGFPGAS